MRRPPASPAVTGDDGVRRGLPRPLRGEVPLDRRRRRRPADPWQQLRLAIEAVFRSWNSERARTYRSKEGISDDSGTAVTVQAMVFGNRGASSATGRRVHAQPGDRRADAVRRRPVRRPGRGRRRRNPCDRADRRARRAPARGRAPSCATHAPRLEHHYADLCDIEFTIEDGRLWMLQVRVGKRSPQAALRIAVDMAEDPAFPLSRAEAVERVARCSPTRRRVASGRSGAVRAAATGLGASPGVASGRDRHRARGRRGGRRGRPGAILVRAETSPDDVHGMARAAGILTSRGGLASHAAVVARGWGIPAVVGAAGIEVRAGQVVVGGRTLDDGDVITIDGESGEVFAGAIAGTTRGRAGGRGPCWAGRTSWASRSRRRRRRRALRL